MPARARGAFVVSQGAGRHYCGSQDSDRNREFFHVCFLLSADESGGHRLTGAAVEISENSKIFGFQNSLGRPFRGAGPLRHSGSQRRGF